MNYQSNLADELMRRELQAKARQRPDYKWRVRAKRQAQAARRMHLYDVAAIFAELGQRRHGLLQK